MATPPLARRAVRPSVHPSAAGVRLRTLGATLGYRDRVVSRDLTVDIPDRAFTAITGPNACGKSTLLRSLVRLLQPQTGKVLFDDRRLHDYRGPELARLLGFLPQEALAPEGITVQRLVARGRFPHQTLLSTWSEVRSKSLGGASRPFFFVTSVTVKDSGAMRAAASCPASSVAKRSPV